MILYNQRKESLFLFVFLREKQIAFHFLVLPPASSASTNRLVDMTERHKDTEFHVYLSNAGDTK